MSAIPDNLQFEQELWGRGMVRIAGVDEVGRGPLAGPVVAAAVIFASDCYIPGVTDSKKLSAARREALCAEINRLALAVGIGVVDNQEIDRINIRQATFAAMRLAIASLALQPDFLLVDGEQLPQVDYDQQALIKGDSRSFSIGAASIVAKVTRDAMMQEMHRQYPEYGFDRHKGYGTAGHICMIRQWGPTPLHRRSFLSRIYPDSGSPLS